MKNELITFICLSSSVFYSCFERRYNSELLPRTGLCLGNGSLCGHAHASATFLIFFVTSAIYFNCRVFLQLRLFVLLGLRDLGRNNVIKVVHSIEITKADEKLQKSAKSIAIEFVSTILSAFCVNSHSNLAAHGLVEYNRKVSAR